MASLVETSCMDEQGLGQFVMRKRIVCAVGYYKLARGQPGQGAAVPVQLQAVFGRLEFTTSERQ
jgi:hypothetical protein